MSVFTSHHRMKYHITAAAAAFTKSKNNFRQEHISLQLSKHKQCYKKKSNLKNLAPQHRAKQFKKSVQSQCFVIIDSKCFLHLNIDKTSYLQY